VPSETLKSLIYTALYEAYGHCTMRSYFVTSTQGIS